MHRKSPLCRQRRRAWHGERKTHINQPGKKDRSQGLFHFGWCVDIFPAVSLR